VPTFCRHNRFIERCPICSKALPGQSPAGSPSRASAPTRTRTGGSPAQRSRRAVHAEGVRVRREGRAQDDGYRCELVPGLRASADAARLAEEIALSAGRLLALAADPPGLYGEIRALARSDLERATWWCLLLVYLSPLEGADPFAGIRRALTASPAQLPDLDGIPLGARTCHDPARGQQTLIAYRQWVARGGRAGAVDADTAAAGSQALAFVGDPGWDARRRFERLFERLSLPGLTRAGRYELLLELGRLGCYELAPDALHFAGADDQATQAAKRVFGIGDAMLLERRAAALAQALAAPLEALDLALYNWVAAEPARLGFPPETRDEAVLHSARAALGL